MEEVYEKEYKQTVIKKLVLALLFMGLGACALEGVFWYQWNHRIYNNWFGSSSIYWSCKSNFTATAECSDLTNSCTIWCANKGN